MGVTVYRKATSCDSCKIEYGDRNVQGNKDTTVRVCYVFTVNDSPHPQASVTLGFLNSNFELGLNRQTDSWKSVVIQARTLAHPRASPFRFQ
jgi:hypothetical protein